MKKYLSLTLIILFCIVEFPHLFASEPLPSEKPNTGALPESQASNPIVNATSVSASPSSEATKSTEEKKTVTSTQVETKPIKHKRKRHRRRKYHCPECQRESFIKREKRIGYALADDDKEKQALPHLIAAAMQSPYDYALHAKLGEIYDDLGQGKNSFYAYSLAAASPDPKININAKKQMASNAGVQDKVLPDPYFSDLYFSPYYLPRFNDVIYPIIFRLGRNLLPEERLQVYGTVYFTKDSQSVAGAFSQIYDDNYIAADLGIRYTPFKNNPFYIYFEAGEAYNIVIDPDISNHRWQYDVRGGFDYYQDWGAADDYFHCLTFPFKQVGDVYADFSYYSRYKNWIGELIVREGFRAAAYHFTSVDFYWKVLTTVDTRREFFNNVLESGAGIAITPFNLHNILIRGELTRGYYYPIHSRSPNPYNKFYNSSLIMVEGYLAF